MFLEQYKLVLNARSALFEYLSTVSSKDFVKSSSNFGKGGSMRNMMVHICNTYQGWLSDFVPGRKAVERDYEEISNLDESRIYYLETDELMYAFIDQHQDNPMQELVIDTGQERFRLSPLRVFTHVITHEFHHKGQIVSLSRLWGYEPTDTDILR